jgi:hypothetical protein
MVRHAPSLLLVNPLAHDFAAYDFWARPLGLLAVGGALERGGARVQLLDCLDPLSPHLPADLRPHRRQPGRGRFARTPLPREAIPERLRAASPPGLHRRYSRYGLPPERLDAALRELPRPDMILMTSMMTYWYPGVRETVSRLKARWPDVPLLLGGVYATLCPEHARARSGADEVIPGPLAGAAAALGARLGLELDSSRAPPAHHLLPHADAAALRTSVGCPLRCAYCGVRRLHPRHETFPPARVEQEVRAIARLGIREIAIYDDALLASPERALEILERIAGLGLPLRLHAAAGLGCRGLSAEVARAMRRAGFATIRIGLETSDPVAQARLGAKLTTGELEAALVNLETAGYARHEIGVYVLAGLPGQRRAEIEQSIDLVLRLGARPHLSEYTPVPGSPLFGEAAAASRWDLAAEPLFHNPTLLPCSSDELDLAALAAVKQELRRRLAG